MDNHKYRFDVINVKNGIQEPYIGIFESKQKAEEWHEVHGKWHEKMGRPLILVQCQVQYRDFISGFDINFEED